MLPSGDSLWVFGDTIEGPFKSIHGLELTRFRSNTAAIVPRQDASDGIKRFRFLAEPDGKRPRQIVPFAPDEDPAVHRVWAIHGVCLRKQIYLFYHRITLLKGVDVFVNFQLDGMGIARADVDELRFTRAHSPGRHPGVLEGATSPASAYSSSGPMTTSICGAAWRRECTWPAPGRNRSKTWPATSILSKRRPPASRTPRPRWSKKFQPTAKLFDSVPNEMSAAYNPYLRKHVAFHSLHRENKIVMRTAPRITGPWSEAEVVYRPERVKDTDLIYAAKEHPELAREGGRVLYVTFVNSATYVPQLIELTLK